MCNTTIRSRHGVGLGAVAQIDGRPVLQPACNRVLTSEAAARPAKKSITPLKPPVPLQLPSAARDSSTAAAATDHDDTSGAIIDTSTGSASPTTTAAAATRQVAHATKASTPAASSKSKNSTSKTVNKRSDDPNGLNSSGDKPVSPKPVSPAAALRKKSKKSGQAVLASVNFGSTTVPLFFVRPDISTSEPGSIAAAQREQATLRQAQRKMRIAHYGRTPGNVATIPSSSSSSGPAAEEKRRCSFITSNSDPIYVAYHDLEWGVPVHDDKMLFELLVLAGAQVGLDWTSILKTRDSFRAAFAAFDAEVVAKLSERQMATISSEYRIDMGRVRSVVENAGRILEVEAEFGSLDEYIWGFVNHQPISTRYSSSRKIPVKTSKSEAISKDMVRRGFRFAGPTVIHSFMQAAGLTNDHLLSCPRRCQLQQQVATKGSSAPTLATGSSISPVPSSP